MHVWKKESGVKSVGSELLRAVTVKISVFYDLTPSSTVNVNRWFGEVYRLHLQFEEQAKQDAGDK
jgi:hypothetical protein